MMSETTTIHRDNAYRYSDNYTIVAVEGPNVFGCEHNHEEAEAIAKWISYNRGHATKVIKNSPDQVRASKAIRPGDPYRYQLREEALTDMGVWATPTRRRRKAR